MLRSGRLTSFSIRTRLLGGFGLVLGLLVLIAGIGFMRFLQASDDLDTLTTRSRVDDAIRDIDRDFLNLRGIAREYLLNGAEDARAAMPGAMHQVNGDFDTALRVIRIPARLNQMQKTAGQFAEYRRGIEALTELRARQDRSVHGTLNPLGTEARGGFDKLITESERNGAARASALATEGRYQ